MAFCHSFLPSTLLISMALLLTSCASEPTAGPAAPIPAPAPNIRLEPVLDLLQFKTSHDQIDVLLDRQGDAHVLIAAASTQEVHHVWVSQNGSVQLELVEADSTPSAISAAFDSQARLHLLLDDRHLLREQSAWKPIHDTPWETANVKSRKARFVQGKNGLVWTFLVDGEQVGAKRRWDWYGFGGYAAGIVFPWNSASEKLVMVPEAAMAQPLWYVLDPQDNLDTSNAMLAVDAKENLHIVYEASRSGLAASGQPRYAQVHLMPPQPGEALGLTDHTTSHRQLYPVSGSQIPLLGSVQGGLNSAAAALDAVSGTMLVVVHDTSYTLTHGQWSLPLRLPLPQSLKPKLAPAGGDAFHLMTVADNDVQYLLYTQDSWSTPVKLGRTSEASRHLWDSFGMASNGHNRAFVVWPTETGIVGRWVERVGEFQTLPASGTDDQQTGAKPIPKHLLDFSNGKAKLMTPGWVSGIAEAFAAGTNSPLTQRLHASGQWETLATVVLADNYGDDLRWYYLGRAAEGMLLCDTAEHYYKMSQKFSEHFLTRCLGAACNGIKLPEILGERLMAIGSMRSAGKCSSPPALNPYRHGDKQRF